MSISISKKRKKGGIEYQNEKNNGPDVGLEHMIDINSVMILDVLNYDNWNTINDRATTIDLGSDKKFLHNIKVSHKNRTRGFSHMIRHWPKYFLQNAYA